MRPPLQPFVGCLWATLGSKKAGFPPWCKNTKIKFLGFRALNNEMGRVSDGVFFEKRKKWFFLVGCGAFWGRFCRQPRRRRLMPQHPPAPPPKASILTVNKHSNSPMEIPWGRGGQEIAGRGPDPETGTSHLGLTTSQSWGPATGLLE